MILAEVIVFNVVQRGRVCAMLPGLMNWGDGGERLICEAVSCVLLQANVDMSGERVCVLYYSELIDMAVVFGCR